MAQFGASLRFVELPAVAELLANLGSTGRLSLSNADRKGEVLLRRGVIVGATLGGETGKAALEAIALAFHDGELSFVDGAVEEAAEPLLGSDGQERAVFMQRLNAERRRLQQVIPSFRLVPLVVGRSEEPDAAGGQVTVGASAVQLLPALASGQTIEQLAAQRGLARTLRDVANLIEAGVLSLSDARQATPGAVRRPMPRRVVRHTDAAPAQAVVPRKPAARHIPVRKPADMTPVRPQSAPSVPSSAPLIPSPVVTVDARASAAPLQHPPSRRAAPSRSAPASPEDRIAGWRAAVIRLLRNTGSTPGAKRSPFTLGDDTEPPAPRGDLFPLLPG